VVLKYENVSTEGAKNITKKPKTFTSDFNALPLQRHTAKIYENPKRTNSENYRFCFFELSEGTSQKLSAPITPSSAAGFKATFCITMSEANAKRRLKDCPAHEVRDAGTTCYGKFNLHKIRNVRD
jgi:hypothetical protein